MTMRYFVKALVGENQISSFTVDAADERAARAQAKSQGYAVLAVKPARIAVSFDGLRKTPFPTLLFSRELLALLTAGLSLVEAIETIAEKEPRSEIRKVVDGLRQRLREGQSFSMVLEIYPDAFPPLYAAMVRASEKTGNLPQALERYIAYHEQADSIRRKVINASVYPLLLLVVGGLVGLFLMFYVVPRFSGIYDEMRGDIPFLSRLLLEWGRILEAHSLVVLGAGICGIAAIGYALAMPQTRAALIGALLKIPALGERAKMFQLARLYRALGMLLHGGIPVLTAIDMTCGLLGTERQVQLRAAAEKIRAGGQLSQAFHEHNLTTPVALRLMRVGERSGRMGEMMERTAQFYDEDMARWVDWFTRLFEPLLMVLIGLIIGTIVVLMYMPIFELAGSIQ